MIEKFNFHTHTEFCDAKNTAEEMVLSAIEKGVVHLGFSSHSYTPFDLGYSLTPKNEKEYFEHILHLKQKYKGKINIYAGIEQEYFSDAPKFDYDYIIGSVHYVNKNNEFYSVDKSHDDFVRNIENAFGGDIYAYIEDFYALYENLLEKTNTKIVGHFDLVTKYNKGGLLFDENHPRYINASNKALDTLCKKDAIFEVNTGVIARGHKGTPYPSERLLKRIYQNGARVTFSTDCHKAEFIDYGFYEAVELIKACGFKSIYVPMIDKDVKI